MGIFNTIGRAVSPTFQRRYAQSFKLRDALIELKDDGLVSVMNTGYVTSDCDLSGYTHLGLYAAKNLGIEIAILANTLWPRWLHRENFMARLTNSVLNDDSEKMSFTESPLEFFEKHGGGSEWITLTDASTQFYDAPKFHPNMGRKYYQTDLLSTAEMKERIRSEIDRIYRIAEMQKNSENK